MLDDCVLANDLMAGTGGITFSIVDGAVVAVASFGAGVGVLVDSAGFATAGAGACLGATLSGRDEEMIAGSSAGVATVGGGGPPAARRAGGVYRLGCPEARGWKLRWTPLYLKES